MRHLGITSISLLFVGQLLCFAATAQGVEHLYATRAGMLEVIEPNSATIVEVRQLKPLAPSRLLAFDGADLFSQTVWSGFPDELSRSDPASALIQDVGYLPGHGGTFRALDFDPVSRQLYGIWGVNGTEVIHVVDVLTGQATPVCRLQTPTLIVLAFHPSGTAYSFTTAGGGPVQLCTVDMSTGDVHLLGQVSIAAPLFRDMAFDRSGNMWLSMLGTNQTTGIYTLDLQTLVGVKRLSATTSTYYGGLSFGPMLDVTTYCTAKANGLGCVPEISSVGLPTVSSPSGFVVRAESIVNNTVGQLVISTMPGLLPFQGGWLCMSAPVTRAPAVTSGGTPGLPVDCTGSWSFDLNSYVYLLNPLPAGTTLYVQWWGRDPTSSPFPSSASNALEIVFQP